MKTAHLPIDARVVFLFNDFAGEHTRLDCRDILHGFFVKKISKCASQFK